MRVVIVNARRGVRTVIECGNDIREAAQRAGLNLDRLDHSKVENGLAIIVDDFGMFEPVENQDYFSIGSTLYAGNAVLYSYDEKGNAVDIRLAQLPMTTFYETAQDIEEAIAADIIKRPALDDIGWQWPMPRPDLDKRQERIRKILEEHGEVTIGGVTIKTLKP